MNTDPLGFIHVFVPAEPTGPAPPGALPDQQRHGRPPDPPASGVTLLLLHGTGGDENDLLPLGRLLLPGAALLSPRGQVLEAGMPRFFRRLAEGVFDLEDLARRTDDLADFVLRAADAYQLDMDKLVAVGFSNGANIASSVLLRRPGVITRAVLLGAMVPFEPTSNPDLRGTAVFLGAGRLDPVASPEQTGRLAEILDSCGAEVTVHWSAGGHEIRADAVTSARAWLDTAFAPRDG